MSKISKHKNKTKNVSLNLRKHFYILLKTIAIMIGHSFLNI